MMPRLRLSTTHLLIGLALLAAAVRLWGIAFGLPYVYHVDEARFGEIAIGFFTGDLNPHHWHVPPLYTYLVGGVWWVYFMLGKLAGTFTDAASFIAAFNRDPSVFLILGRLVTAALSLGTIALVYVTGKRMFGVRAGLLAALFLTLSPEHNRISHYMNPDAPMVFFLVLAFYFVWNVYKRGRPLDYYGAGIAAGLAFATKYGGHVMFLPLFLAHVFRVLESGLPRRRLVLHPPLIASGVLFFAAFVAATPHVILAFPEFWEGFRWQSQHLFTLGHFGSSTAQPTILFYLQYGFRENVGLLAQFLVLGGVLHGLVRLRRREIILLSAPLVLFALMSAWKTYATRYMLPVAPFFILIAARCLDLLLERLRAGPRRLDGGGSPAARGLRTAAAALLVGLVLIHPAAAVVKFDWSLAHEDTRTTAKNWIDARLPAGSRIALEAYCPILSEGRFQIHSRQPSLSQIDLEWLALRRIDFVVVSELEFGRFVPYPEEFPREARFYRSLDEKAVLVKTFAPRFREDLLTMHNPVIKVYRLGGSPDPGFPGRFAAYGQRVSLLRTGEGGWVIQSAAAGRDPWPGDERVLSSFVRVTDASGREAARLIMAGPAEAASSADFEQFGASEPFDLPAGASLSIGYEFEVLSPPPGWDLPARLIKETVLARSLGNDPGDRTRLDFLYLYAAFPGSRGDDHVQTAVFAGAGGSWSLTSEIRGGELRWGDDRLAGPFVRVLDAGGGETGTFVLTEGTVGSLDADRNGPVRASFELPALPEGARVFAGYAYYLDGQAPDKAGGPETLEFLLPPPFSRAR